MLPFVVPLLQLFLTSRCETHLCEGDNDIPETERQHLILYRIAPEVVDHDIHIFLEQKLESMIQNKASEAAGFGNDILWQQTGVLIAITGTAGVVRRASGPICGQEAASLTYVPP
jgi:hypothetical protein